MSQLKKVISGLSFKKSEKNQYNLCYLVKKYNRINSLRKGYLEMASLNLSIAQMCFDADNEVFRQYEEKLTECE